MGADSHNNDTSLELPLRESGRVSSSDKEKREVIVDIIEAGPGNSRDRRVYDARVLEASAKVFEGAKMFVDHLTPDMEKRLGGMPRSIRDLTGRIHEAWWNPTGGKSGHGSIQGRVGVSAPWLWELVQNDPGLLELSINAVGRTKPTTGPDGAPSHMVEAITHCHSVDWVAQAGAGGRVLDLVEAAIRNESAEADVAIDWSKVTVAELRENAPAVVEEIENSQLEQMKADLAELERLVAEEEAKLEASDPEDDEDEDSEESEDPAAQAKLDEVLDPEEDEESTEEPAEEPEASADPEDAEEGEDDGELTEGYFTRDEVKDILREAVVAERKKFEAEQSRRERIADNRDLATEMITAAGFPSISTRKLIESFREFDGSEKELRESVRAAIADKRSELREVSGRGVTGAGRSVPASQVVERVKNAHEELMAELGINTTEVS